ncbi:hypothetical protein MHC_02280 [Mycoplasma haemocanis str. Illinois]|uniref:Uncharacterized protein n=1 Tax=Mycoplasma haemocanis (strain Illinois) TaxID=1111676 RepID=H6N6Q0_MYCHN|nr:hypothetical protein [Mycoplasma haemocanis]AEW45322.1 hypothetical protein MHC_02280 [Mycoplasma haemocanis str. Illinois]
MAKIILGGPMLVAGIGLGGIGLTVTEARDSQKSTVSKSKSTFSLPTRCDIYSVERSNDTSGTAKWREPSFRKELRHLEDQVAAACASFGKVYIAWQGDAWRFRQPDQSKKWEILT